MAQAAAARLITRIVDAQAARGSASVVLTGGRNGNGLLAALAASPARDAVDWSRLDLWWGDERFLPDGDPERNVHPGPRGAAGRGAAGPGAGARDAAPRTARTATTWKRRPRRTRPNWPPRRRPEDHGPVPAFDVLLLGVGPDTHVASLFPELPAVRETERTVVGVHGAPKPPPIRISLTLPAIRAAREVWLLAAGEDKAERGGHRALRRGRGPGPGGRARGRAAPCGCWTRRRPRSCRATCTRRRRPTGRRHAGRVLPGGAGPPPSGPHG